MKPLYCAIATSVMLALLTVLAPQAKAEDNVRSTAYEQGRAAGRACVAAGPSCEKFAYPYPATTTDATGNTSENQITEAQALDNTDYVAGFIVGKSEANSK